MWTLNGHQWRKMLLATTSTRSYLAPLGTIPIFLHFLLVRLSCVEPVHEMHTHLPTYTLYTVMHGPFTTTSLERHSGNEPRSRTALNAGFNIYSTFRSTNTEVLIQLSCVSFKSRTNLGIGLILRYPSLLSHLSFLQLLNPAFLFPFQKTGTVLCKNMRYIYIASIYTFTTDSTFNKWDASDKSCP